MEKRQTKKFLKFFIPSLLGVFLFVTPIKYNGEITVPIAKSATLLLEFMGDYSKGVISVLIVSSGIFTIAYKLTKLDFIKQNTFLKSIFEVRPFWFTVRILGACFALMLYFETGPDFIISPITGGLIAQSLMPILVCVFFLAGLLLPLLLNYGLLDFFGAILIKFMRPVFNLPGRSALDCLASWLGDGSIGVMLTSKQYQAGYYSKREATVICTTFSVVSITFSLVVIGQVGLSHLFVPFYLTVAAAGIIAAVIVPKLPPLSKISDSYNKDIKFDENVPIGHSPAKYGLKLALEKAESALSVKDFFKEGFKNVIEMWFCVLPVILTFGTIALIIAENTPVFKILGAPFIPIYMFFGIPEAQDASATVIVGFADMFLPSVIASSRISAEITRFIVAATSVSQLIYMSEIGSIIMGSTIPVSIKNLFIIFLERTIITLPVIIIIAKFIF